MKKLIASVLLAFATCASAQENVPEIPFTSVPDFLKLPKDLHLGEASAVALNSKGHIFVFSRGGTAIKRSVLSLDPRNAYTAFVIRPHGAPPGAVKVISPLPKGSPSSL